MGGIRIPGHVPQFQEVFSIKESLWLNNIWYSLEVHSAYCQINGSPNLCQFNLFPNITFSQVTECTLFVSQLPWEAEMYIGEASWGLFSGTARVEMGVGK